MKINSNYSSLKLSFGMSQKKLIQTFPSSPCPQKFINDLAEGIKSLGQSGRQTIKAQNLKFQVAQKMSDIRPDLKELEVRGQRGCTVDYSPAFSSNGTIQCLSSPISRDKFTIYILRHEVGHELDKAFSKKIGRNFTQTDGYKEAYADDLKNMEANIANYKGQKPLYYDYFLDYMIQESTSKQLTIGGLEESFAELAALNTGGSVAQSNSKGMDEFFKHVFPKTNEYIKKLLYLLGDR